MKLDSEDSTIWKKISTQISDHVNLSTTVNRGIKFKKCNTHKIKQKWAFSDVSTEAINQQ